MLERTCPTLPFDWYHDPAHYRRELESIWWCSWICVGRESDWPAPGDWRTHAVDALRFFVVRSRDGCLRAFHNTCRHRGAELCAGSSGRFASGRIVCPYHGWAYALDGRLIDTPRRVPTADFEPADHGLYEIALTCWRGFVFVNPAERTRQTLEQALGREAEALAAWPLDKLGVAHRETHEVACNWKIFWENYSECAHCPGVHPALSRLVPLYREGFMSPDDLIAVGRADETGALSGLREGAVTWSDSGTTQLPCFMGLETRERDRGHSFCTLWPGMFLVAHVDYVRLVELVPCGPERIRLRVSWFLDEATLAAGPVDLATLTDFGRRVVLEDAAICQIQQRGLRSPRRRAGVLMPQEYEVLAFDNWVRERLDEPGM